MNRSRIEWCDHTWNPVTGCRHGCEYCYARRMTTRFAGDIRLNLMAKKDYSLAPAADGGEDLYVLDAPMLNETGNPLVYPFGFAPTLHKYRMDIPEKLKMGCNIFVGAMADIFGAWVPEEWIKDIFTVCMREQRHNFLFLTKNPARYIQSAVPEGYENLWYGTTITCNANVHRILPLMMNAKTFVSLEPLHEHINTEDLRRVCQIVDWIIIGAETGYRRGKVVPEAAWIKDIVLEADNVGKPVFMKDSLIPVVGEKDMRRDFPEQLRKKVMSEKVEKKIYGECCSCRSHIKKREMVTLLSRTKRGEQPKQFGFMCKKCFKEFCLEKEIDISSFHSLANFIGWTTTEAEAGER